MRTLMSLKAFCKEVGRKYAPSHWPMCWCGHKADYCVHGQWLCPGHAKEYDK